MIDFWREFEKLRAKAPRLALSTVNNTNSPYTNFCTNSKNCHLIFGADSCEDCYYGVTVLKCTDCIDSQTLYSSTLCYECVDSEQCYNCNYLQDCRECTDSSYLFDCIGCESCFGCAGLRHKKFYIFNEPYSKEDYEKKMEEIASWPRGEAEKKFEEVKMRTPRVFARMANTENSYGDFLVNTKNCFYCFDAKEAEDSMYCDRPIGVKDSVDTANMFKNCEMCYQVMSGIDLNNVNFSFLCWYCHDVEYSMYCFNSNHLFGCISLNHKEYIILNKQYEKETWFKTVAEIKDQMRREGTYGKMFESDFPYEDSIARDYLS